MKQLYRFSPIKTEEQLFEAIHYTAAKTTQLCKKITGNEYPIRYLTVFAHYTEEFEYLKTMLTGIGEIIGDNNGPFAKLTKPIRLPNNELHKLRIRKPDPYRLHVGCNDFVVSDYKSFKENYLESNPANLRLVARPDYEMIEFFDSDYDVLAYVVSKEL